MLRATILSGFGMPQSPAVARATLAASGASSMGSLSTLVADSVFASSGAGAEPSTGLAATPFDDDQLLLLIL